MSKKQVRHKEKKSIVIKSTAHEVVGTAPKATRFDFGEPLKPHKFEEELEAGRDRLEKNPPFFLSSNARPYVPITRDTKQTRGYTAPIVGYSDEVKAHINFLYRTQGQEAVDSYLKNLRSQKVEHNTSPFGPIETALKDAQAKVTAWEAKEREARAEKEQAVRVRDALERAYRLALGKPEPAVAARPTSIQTTDPLSQPKAAISWMDEIRIVLNQERTDNGVDKLLVYSRLKEKFPDQKQTVYNTVGYYIKTGRLVEDKERGTVFLPEWTEPTPPQIAG